MKEVNIKDWKLLIAPEQTKKFLRNIKSDAETCGCSYCRNFIAGRNTAFSEEFIHILETLGIDFKRDVQTSHLCKTAEGRHQYDVNYYFVGKIVQMSKLQGPTDISSFNFIIDENINYRSKEFSESELILRLECFPIIPWMIEEKEPET